MATPELPKALTTQLSRLTTEVMDYQPLNEVTYRQALDSLSVYQQMRRQIQKHYKAIKDPINQARKKILTLEKADLDRVSPGEDRLQRLIRAFLKQRTALPTAAPQPDGDSTALRVTPPVPHRKTTRRTVTITDFAALVSAVERGDVPIEALEPNIPYLTQRAKQEEGLFQMPGVHVDTTITIVTT